MLNDTTPPAPVAGFAPIGDFRPTFLLGPFNHGARPSVAPDAAPLPQRATQRPAPELIAQLVTGLGAAIRENAIPTPCGLRFVDADADGNAAPIVLVLARVGDNQADVEAFRQAFAATEEGAAEAVQTVLIDTDGKGACTNG